VPFAPANQLGVYAELACGAQDGVHVALPYNDLESDAHIEVAAHLPRGLAALLHDQLEYWVRLGQAVLDVEYPLAKTGALREPPASIVHHRLHVRVFEDLRGDGEVYARRRCDRLAHGHPQIVNVVAHTEAPVIPHDAGIAYLRILLEDSCERRACRAKLIPLHISPLLGRSS